jgi:NAD(P)-dependent dehydrogenase (short-subunit alcohol dehydrogenase family)
LAAFVDKLAMGTATPEDMLAAAGPRLQFPTSVCFAGDDLRTVSADRPSHLTRPGRGRGPCAGAGADLARSEELTGAMARLVEAFGRVDVLVNAAGTDCRARWPSWPWRTGTGCRR